MTDFPDVKLKALVQFPARVLDGAGIDIVKQNGSYQFNLDFGDFAPPVTSIADPSHQNFLLWNDITGQYALASTILVSGSGPPGPAGPVGPAGPPGASGTGSGNVNGPAGAVADRIAVYNGTSGTVIKDGGQTIANVIASAGSFIQAGSGAVTRTIQNKARDIVSVKDFGAIGNGSNDDTSAIQAAINAVSASGGGEVFVPNGAYVISSTLTIPGSVTLRGAGSAATVFTTSNSTLNFIAINGFYAQLRGITLTMSVTPTSGAAIALNVNCFSHILDDIFILNCWNGIDWKGSNNATRLSIGFANNIRIYNFRNIAMNFQCVNDVFVNKFLIYQKDIAMSFGAIGVALTDNCEAIILQDGDVVGGQRGFVFGSAAPTTIGARPAYNRLTNVYFDSNVHGNVINACVETIFNSVWFSGATAGTDGGLEINECDTVQYIGCQWFNNGWHGCLLNSGAKHVIFSACSFSDNCKVATAGTGHGLTIADSAVGGVQVIGGAAKNGNYGGSQGYGINVGTGVSNLLINGVDVRGNVTGGIGLGTVLSTSVVIRNCIGFVTEARGVAAILNGNAANVIAHGLNGIPTTVICTLKDTGGGSQTGGANIPRVLNVGVTNFTYDLGVVVSADRPFSWKAEL